ncbi:MAG TPA: tripartite tricarboxylate transporter TctB family protein [Candidatus Methylomirabilis sp.]|nr:tripartite tricarboxylate transporter TctB family protein [Candidatus Methylomirabilis sp.]
MILEIIFLIAGTLGIYEGVRLTQTTLLYADSVGPGWYLLFMSCLLFVCAMALLVRRFIRRKAAQAEVGISLHKGAAGRAFLLLFLYGASVIYLGYVVGSVIFFTLVQRIFGERSWVRCAVIGVSITACFYFVFSYLASVPLP